MRFNVVSVLGALTLLGGASAAITDYITELPQCGLSCLLEILPASVCGVTNETCICENQEVAHATTKCVSERCSVVEQLRVANISEISCGRIAESRQNYLLTTVGLEGVVVIAGALRFYSRMSIDNTFGWDDYIMAVALLSSVPFAVMGVLSAHYGFGRNIWEIKPDDLTLALKFFFIGELLYMAILGLSKLSILVFYLRIFPSNNFRRCGITVITLTILSTIAFLVVTLFHCYPISYSWNGWRKESPGKCTNLNAQTYATSATNIFLDFCVLLLPLPWLWKLQVSTRKKINLLLMFSIGIFICITSIVRLTRLVEFKATTNPTKDYVDSIYWSGIEAYVSLIVPCLPSVRSLLSRKFPKVFGMDTTRGTRNAYMKSGPSDTFAMTHKSAQQPEDMDLEDHGVFLKSLTTHDKSNCQVSAKVESKDLQTISEDGMDDRGGIMVVKETQVHNTV